MCLIAFAWRVHPRYELAVIANRDEAHARPAAAAALDPQQPDLYGGRDIARGGSWLLASTRGRLAAVTNVRVGLAPEAAPLSRGALVRDFAAGTSSGEEFLDGLVATAADYGRFNLLLWDSGSLWVASNHPRFSSRRVAPGVHAMSNGAFDARWPKSTHATVALSRWLATAPGAGPAADSSSVAPLFDALADTTRAPDGLLPDTGVGIELERTLSPPFVRGIGYGTRCSTVVLVEAGAIHFAEREFGPDAEPLGGTAAILARPG